VAQGLEPCLYLGNLDALRDWGHAKDYVRMQWMMLQQDEPRDFVIATGQQHSVRQFVEKAASRLGVQLEWRGEGVKEEGVVASVSGDRAPAVRASSVIVRVDPRYFRPAEVETLLGDASAARGQLGWVPEISLDEMIDEMVEVDLEQARRHALLRQHGYRMSVTKG
jgi:GDPmannose 4,6-dehydratase